MRTWKRARYFVGVGHDLKRVTFRSHAEPRESTHGETYAYCIGPFDTARGAAFMRDYGQGNPHCQCVGDAERLARALNREDK